MSFSLSINNTYTVVSYIDSDITAADLSGRISLYDKVTKTWGAPTAFTPEDTLDATPHGSLQPGAVFFEWTPLVEGTYKIEFYDQWFSSVTLYIVGPLEPETTLGVTKTYYFLGQLDPLYIDPNEVLKYFPDGDLIEITEYVHMFSRELEIITGKTNITDITPLMENFILASVLCRLSRIYTFAGGMSGFGAADSFTLGDLSVKHETGKGGSSNGGYGDGGAATWCDLAAALKAQLSTGSAGMIAIVTGTNFANPIPERGLRRHERR